ncbi:interleukin-15 receptor subunit alpha isoform X3 [Hemicordylus capensis]|uniref:interleukin-15 receptor subunit alpha isoform X3 n=1 Tax=Hemicordylus capensis TaxID=884348 RepID=UPI0023029767|nr:interleukin-15 receptor subunit alpha isoform X3 [Hemicordylus capensis]
MAWLLLALLCCAPGAAAAAAESGPSELRNGMCGRPEEIKNAQMEANGPWYNGTRIRYSCAKGYKRKAGTSNLIVCRQNKSMFEWSLPNLTCIRDPSTTDPPNTTEDFRKGSPGIRIAFTCTVVPFIVIILGLLLWCFYRKNRDIPGTVPPLEEIPMTSKGSEERSQMIATASYLDDQGPCREGDQALLPQDVPSTG